MQIGENISQKPILLIEIVQKTSDDKSTNTNEVKRMKTKKKNRIVKLKKSSQLYLLLLPAIIQVLIFRYGPIYGIQIAFKNYASNLGIMGSPWTGFSHFIRFFNSFNFTEILRNTLVLSFSMLIFTFPIPIIFALLLNQVQVKCFRKVLQTVSYAPYFISTVVVVSMLYTFLSPSSGIINFLLEKIGMEPYNFMGSAKCFVPTYVISAIWQTTGYSSVIYIAALAGVNGELYEAAKVDGASKFQRVLHIDLPSIMPTATILLVMSLGQIMNVGFEKAYLMQNALNLSRSEIIATYVYKVGLEQARYDFSTAINLFNTVINFILLLVVNRGAKKLNGNSLW